MNFKSGNWNKEVNVRDFIQRNYTPYDGGKEFLAAPTERTKALWNQLLELMKVERERKGVYDIDEKTISTITAHDAGYINKDLEQIVGLQTDAPLKRAIMPFGGIRLIHTQLEAYGRQMDPIVDHVFKYRKTHNDGVFDVYTDEMKRARHAGIMTGLPDAYGRGRIIGDYRRVALYGVDFLIVQKQAAKKNMVIDVMDSDHIRKREEIAEQIKALKELKAMAAKYGFDISRPAEDTKEAIQWLYFGYLAAVEPDAIQRNRQHLPFRPLNPIRRQVDPAGFPGGGTHFQFAAKRLAERRRQFQFDGRINRKIAIRQRTAIDRDAGKCFRTDDKRRDGDFGAPFRHQRQFRRRPGDQR